MDGSLTGKGPNTWVTPNFKFLHQPECTVDLDKYDGVICDATTQLRRVVFHAPTPFNIFQLQPMHIMKWDDDLLANANKTEFQLNDTNWDKVLFREK